MRKFAKLVAISVLLFGCALVFESTGYGQSSNVWSTAGQMIQARTGAAAVLLADGKIFTTGGADSNGIPQASAEIFDPATGQFSLATSMTVPRSNHAAIVLTSGDVLVTGGLTSGGGFSDTAEIFSAQTQTWTLLEASLGSGLAKHAMASLPDGNVVIVGGESTTGPVLTLLLFKISDNSIGPVGSLMTGRTNAVAAATPDGRVLIAGGTDIHGAVLSSTEIFVYRADTISGTLSAGPNLTFPRTNATATTTYDGVAVVGGNNGSVDLGSAEIFSQWTNAFRVVSGATPRSGHIASLLPKNGSILAMGGTGGVAVDLLQPWGNSLAGAFIVGAPSATDHNGGIAIPGSLGSLLAAGGTGASATAAEIYWFPTISTDQPDYAPGTSVVMTGVGFQPGETVNLYLREWVNKMLVDPPDYAVTADAGGSFTFTGYAPTPSDIGARYHLTAAGKSSGYQAQTIFTDSTSVKTASIAIQESTCSTVISTLTQGQTACANVSITATNGGGGGSFFIVWFDSSSTAVHTTTETVPSATPATFTNTFTTSGTSPTGMWTVKVCNNAACTPGNTVLSATFTLSAPVSTSTSVTSPTVAYGQTAISTVTVSSATASPTGSVSMSVNNGGTASCTPLTAATSTTSTSTCTIDYSAGGVASSPYTLTATYTPSGIFSSSSGGGTLIVHTATPSFTGLTASQGISYGTASITLSGKLTSSPVNPPSGSTVSITINGVTATTATADAAGDFSTSVTTSSLNASTTSYTITYSYAATLNFGAASNASTALTVNPITPSFTSLTASQSITYGTASVTLGGKLTGSPVNPPSGSTVSITINGVTTTTTTTDAAGDFSASVTTSSLNASTTPYAITYSYAAITNFGAASSASTTLTVNKANATISVTPYNVTYDTSAHTGTATATGVNGANLIADLNLSNTTHTNASTYSADYWTFTDPTGNYNDVAATTITDVIKQATAGITVTPYGVTYDGNPHTATATATGVNGANLIADLTLTGTTHTNAGTYSTDSWSFTDSMGNYNNDSGTVSDLISQATPTLSLTCTEVTYDGNTHSCVGTAKGVSGATVSGTWSYIPASETNAGSYPTTGTFTSTDANYVSGGTATGTLKIDQATPTLSLTCTEVTYDGQPHSCVGTAKGVSGATVSGSWGYNPASDTSAGSYPTTGTFSSTDANYVSGGTATGTLKIDPLAVTLTAGSYSGTYDGSTHALTACSSTQSTFVTCTNNPTGPVGPDVNSVVVSPAPVYAQGSSSDYTITSDSGSWSITPLAVTVTGGSYSGTYDGTAHSPSACTSTYAGVGCTNNPDSVGSDVGSGAVAPASSIASGIAADYVITPKDGSWSISPLALTLTAGSYSAMYDGIAHALSTCASTQPSFVTCSNNPSGPVGPDVGSGDVTPTVFYDKGSSIDYSITSNTGAWSITALAVTVTGGSYSGTYDGSTYQPSDCTSSYTGVGCTNNPNSVGPDVGSGAVAPASSIATGIAADYIITPKDGLWTISPLAVTVTAGGYSNTYDGSAHAPSACASSYAGVSCNNLPNSVGPDVGSGMITPASKIVTGIPADYTINPVNGAWSITALAVTVTGGSYSGTYDGTAHSPSACTSTDAGVGCTNNPDSVGPDVGSGAVAPASSIASGIAADYIISPKNGAWSISPLAVTITAGNYTGLYDGSAHALSACSSTQQGFVTCSNNPAGPIGPDVGSGEVTPTLSYAKGSSNDYTITTSNGSWSITSLPVTFTAGNYTGSFDGTTHAVSACISSSSTLVTCTNNPAGPIGPGAGSGVVNPITVYLQGSSIDYMFTPKNGSWNISKTQPAFSGMANQTILYATSSTTVTGVISAPGPVYPPSGETVSIVFNGSTVQAMIGANGVFIATFDTHAIPVSPSAYSITYNYAGDSNFLTAPTASTTLSVKYAGGGICDGDVGHQILQPINADGSSVFNSKSTSPAKFRVCDANHVSVGTPGVVKSFVLYQVASGTVTTTVNEPVDSTTPDVVFRWDPTSQQWIFNISNKDLSGPNKTYYFLITLNDGSSIAFNYGLK